MPAWVNGIFLDSILVFPIGGVKGKVLAARRVGIKRVILPRRNEPDVKDIPEEALQDLEIVFAERIDDLLKNTLMPAVEKPAEQAGEEVGEMPPAKEPRVDGKEATA